MEMLSWRSALKLVLRRRSSCRLSSSLWHPEAGVAAEVGADGGLDVASLAREQEPAALSLQLLALLWKERALHHLACSSLFADRCLARSARV